MSRQAKTGIALMSVLALVILIGCSAKLGQVPGSGAFVTFTILGKSFTFSFGDAGVITAQADQTVVQAAAIRLFEENPPQTAPSGQMELRSSDVGVARLLNAKEIVRQQALPYYGTATIRFSIASGSSADLCESATLLSEYTLNLTAGVPSIADETYELSAEALDIIATNDVTLCIEVASDFDGVITLDQFGLTFGGGSGGAADVSFLLRNTEFENIHILLPNESFGPSNRITPGSSRSATVSGVGIGDSVTLRAGRNGVVLDTETCPTVEQAEYTATATWDGYQLTCTAEQQGGGGTPVGTELQIPINSEGDAASPTATYNGVDYGIVGVLNTNTPDAPAADRPSSVNVDLRELGLQYVERIYLAQACAWASDLANGVVFGTLTAAYEEGGTPTTLDFIMGTNTAEWSYERPEHETDIGGVPHSLVSILYSSPTTIDSAFEYDGYMFWTSMDLDTSRTLASLTLSIADPATLARHPLNPVPTWSGLSIVGATLVGPAGAPGN